VTQDEVGDEEGDRRRHEQAEVPQHDVLLATQLETRQRVSRGTENGRLSSAAPLATIRLLTSWRRIRAGVDQNMTEGV